MVLVWGVAATFVGFDLVFMRVMGSFMGVSKPTVGSQTCVVEVGPAAKSPSSEVLVGAWLLGLASGRDALARQYDSVDRETLARHIAEVAPIAESLGVPPSAIFVPQHVANANLEFIAFVEGDPSGTARRLAVRHGAQPCHLYKLGAFWGYASLVRPSLPGTRTIFGPEISHHAGEASLPPGVWRPLLEAPPADDSYREIGQDSIVLTQRVTLHLQRPR